MKYKRGLITRRKFLVNIGIIVSINGGFVGTWSHLFAADKELDNMKKNNPSLITPFDISSEELLKEENRNKKISHSFPALKQELAKQLSAIKPSIYDKVNYYPCKVELLSGEFVENVIVVEAPSYFSQWGAWPNEDRGKKEIKLQKVRRIFTSNFRLPIEFSQKIENIWETGMGYKLFYFVFKDGDKVLARCGGQCDFFEFKDKYKIADIIDVVPFDTNNSTATKPEIKPATYFWCLVGSTPKCDS